MVQQPPVPIALRPRRGMILVVPALLLTLTLGCGHRRTSMRPVYTIPAAPAATVVPACPTSVAPSTVEPGGIETLDPAPVAEPGPPLNTPAGPATASPPRPDEPSLDAPTTTPSSARPSSGSSMRNRSLVPSARRGLFGRPREASLRDNVRPYVNDPDDLFLPPKAERPWKYVVLHHSANEAGDYAQIDREHRKVLGFEGCGYHFVIGNGSGSPDGQIEVAERWSSQKNGVHCRNAKTPEVNEYGIGICLVGDLDNMPPTARQIAAAKALVTYLGERYSIPAQRMGSHAKLASGPTACPGKHFPEQAILGSKNLALR